MSWKIRKGEGKKIREEIEHVRALEKEIIRGKDNRDSKDKDRKRKAM